MNDLKMIKFKIDELQHKNKQVYYFYTQAKEELKRIENDIEAIKKQNDDTNKLINYHDNYNIIHDNDINEIQRKLKFEYDFTEVNNEIIEHTNLYIQYQNELIFQNEKILKDYFKLYENKKDDIQSYLNEYIKRTFEIRNLKNLIDDDY